MIEDPVHRAEDSLVVGVLLEFPAAQLGCLAFDFSLDFRLATGDRSTAPVGKLKAQKVPWLVGARRRLLLGIDLQPGLFQKAADGFPVNLAPLLRNRRGGDHRNNGRRARRSRKNNGRGRADRGWLKGRGRRSGHDALCSCRRQPSYSARSLPSRSTNRAYSRSSLSICRSMGEQAAGWDAVEIVFDIRLISVQRTDCFAADKPGEGLFGAGVFAEGVAVGREAAVIPVKQIAQKLQQHGFILGKGVNNAFFPAGGLVDKMLDGRAEPVVPAQTP